jgi:hypothetical protein
MKYSRHNQGITRVEMLMVMSAMAVLLFLFFVLVPCGSRSVHKRSVRILCLSNLKQVGLAMQLFAESHQGNFPWVVQTNEGGSSEFTNSPFTFKHFATASNELISPKVLACPADRDKERVADFGSFNNANLSYFVSLDSKPTSNGAPTLVLAGDRNITGGTPIGSLRLYSSNSAIGFTKAMHSEAGNVVLSDGSVRQVTSHGLAQQLQIQPSSIRLAIP